MRLLARSSWAELRGLRREGVLAEGVAGVDDSLSILHYKPMLDRSDSMYSHGTQECFEPLMGIEAPKDAQRHMRLFSFPPFERHKGTTVPLQLVGYYVVVWECVPAAGRDPLLCLLQG